MVQTNIDYIHESSEICSCHEISQE
jgi:hypothetical protein